jgi:hypothetical protein
VVAELNVGRFMISRDMIVTWFEQTLFESVQRAQRTPALTDGDGNGRWLYRTGIVTDGNGTITYEIAGTYEIAVPRRILTAGKTRP